MASDIKKYMKKLLDLEGAVQPNNSVLADVIHMPSPSLNFIFGGTWGLPRGYSMILFGPPRAGKTVLVNAIIGQLHKDDPEAIAVKFDTEMREELQNNPQDRKVWGIDSDRYVCYQVNEPNLIFDRIEKDISAMIDDGAKIKLLVIDSIMGIQGRRGMNADSVMVQQIGDLALTIQDGLKRILPTMRRKGVAIILTDHVRAEMDPIEVMRGKKYKMGGAWALKHFSEYYVLVERNDSKAGKTDLAGNEFIDDSIRDLMEKGEKTGHKIRVKMEDSTPGVRGRVGEFTFSYDKGIVNTHEEVFLLGVNRGVIEHPNNVAYIFGGEKYHGKEAMLKAILNDPALQETILKEVKKQDLDKKFHTESSSDLTTKSI